MKLSLPGLLPAVTILSGCKTARPKGSELDRIYGCAYDEGERDQREYEIRRDQTQRMSILE